MTDHTPSPATDDLRARLTALADETEAWEWSAPVGPGNASYANGHENGRRSVARELHALLAAHPDARSIMDPSDPYPMPGFTGCTDRDPDHCACATDEDVTCSSCDQVIEPGAMVQSVQWPECPGIPLGSLDQVWSAHTFHAGDCPAAHPALLADPAPEAARERVRTTKTAFDGNGWECPRCGILVAVDGAVPCPAGCSEPADLPVATGVTTEDEGDLRLGFMSPAEIAAHDEHYPAPAPVVSAGDEGVGLTKAERERLRLYADQFRPQGPVFDGLIGTVERILAARVAEAGARALREAQSEWASEYDRLTRDQPGEKKSRAAYRMASALAGQRADQIGGA